MMVKLILDQKQADLLRTSRDSVALFDEQGNVLGYVQPTLSEASVIAIAKDRLSKSGKRYSTDEVLAHLRELETR